MGRHHSIRRHISALIAVTLLALAAHQASASITLELTADGFGPGSGKSITLTPADIGNPTSLAVWATVTGNNATFADEGLQSVNLSFTSVGAILGNLANGTHDPDFNAGGTQNGAQFGTPGDLDLGSTNSADVTGWWVARAPTPRSGTGPASNGSGSFQLGTITFTPTSLGNNDGTPLQLTLRASANSILWFEDAVITTPPPPAPPIWSGDKTYLTGTILIGAPITLHYVPEPASMGIVALSAITLLKRRRNPAI